MNTMLGGNKSVTETLLAFLREEKSSRTLFLGAAGVKLTASASDHRTTPMKQKSDLKPSRPVA